MVRLSQDQLSRVEPLFEGMHEATLFSGLQGCMGSVWADCEDVPHSAQVIVGDFCFLAGSPNRQLTRHLTQNFLIFVPQNREWAQMIEQVQGIAAKRVTRFALQTPEMFERNRLNSLVQSMPDEYSIARMNKGIYEKLIRNDQLRDLCANFSDFENYAAHGLGFVALWNGEPVAGASSYSYYNQGIDIEVDTIPHHRRRGLAAACSAQLILECMHRGISPEWDAQNPGSVALAEKLGYHFLREYPVYEVCAATNEPSSQYN